jgi:hypothetical protein
MNHGSEFVFGGPVLMIHGHGFMNHGYECMIHGPELMIRGPESRTMVSDVVIRGPD